MVETVGLIWAGDTDRISRIVLNPKNPNVVFVGALGRAYGPNQDRGVYRSTDAGDSWQKVLFTDDRHGVADLDINPQNPNIVYAALWHFERKPWTFKSGDTLGGLYRSVDGGFTWDKLTNGLPQLVGRIAVKVAPSNPDVVYAMTEAKEGTLYRSDNGGDSFRLVNTEVEIVSRGFYYTDYVSIPPTRTGCMPYLPVSGCLLTGGRIQTDLSRNACRLPQPLDRS